ncbi:MAG: hypothetical protein AAF689_10920 [Pseudomonadota bacterium]
MRLPFVSLRALVSGQGVLAVRPDFAAIVAQADNSNGIAMNGGLSARNGSPLFIGFF